MPTSIPCGLVAARRLSSICKKMKKSTNFSLNDQLNNKSFRSDNSIEIINLLLIIGLIVEREKIYQERGRAMHLP
ncbi:hypothetical protein TSAR_015700 [Trichomalopsis sarcophagae]|uniref:Uncharacterized protein n=1 Tax=Trichomalopsis sarcophagae TaxID=543379 RepID=A0A232F523_9HYME|nr:hypothetical protein TSAR_015700 [Trichomalopsis sarcophagae]